MQHRFSSAGAETVCCLNFSHWSSLEVSHKAYMSQAVFLRVISFNPFSFAVLIFTVSLLLALHSFERPISTHFGTCCANTCPRCAQCGISNSSPSAAISSLSADLKLQYIILMQSCQPVTSLYLLYSIPRPRLY